MNQNKKYLWSTIWNKLYNIHGSSLRHECDIRYLTKWINLYPDCFPKFMVKNQYGFTIHFNNELLRYEIFKKI